MVRKRGISANLRPAAAACPCSCGRLGLPAPHVAGIYLTLSRLAPPWRRMLLDLEIAEERSVEHLEIKVLAPGGWTTVTHVCLTVPMLVWTVTTKNHRLSCAGKHLVITPDGPCAVDQLCAGVMFVYTRTGLELVTSVSHAAEKQQLYDLRVAAEDHIYYTDGIASHNSTGLGAAELFKLNVMPNYRSLYITPMHDQLKTLAEKFMDMQRGSVFPAEYSTSRGIKNSMYYKGSVKGGFLRLMHILTDAGKARGISANSVTVDECVLGTTIIAGVGKSVVLTDLREGDKVLAHDDHCNIRHDTVRCIVHKGYRHTWTITTAGGRSLTCTGNERLRTPSGWRYAAEFITVSACAVCPVSTEIKSPHRGGPRYDPGLYAGGRELPDARGFVSPISSEPQHSAEGLLPAEAEPPERLRGIPGGGGSGQLGVGEPGCEVLDSAVASLRIFTLPVLPSGPDAPRSLCEVCDSGVGGPAELAPSGVVVSGRWMQAGAPDGLCHALVHQGGVCEAGDLADPERRPSRGSSGEKGIAQLLDYPRNDIGGNDTDREDPAVHAYYDALQAAGLHREERDLLDLRRHVHQDSPPRAGATHVLGRLPGGSAATERRETLRHRGAQRGEGCAGAREERVGSFATRGVEAEASSQYASPQGESRLPRKNQRAEINQPPEAESGGTPREEVPDTHLHVLQPSVLEQPLAQYVEEEHLHQLPSGGVPDLESCRCGSQGTPTGEGAADLQAPRLIEDEIASIVYAGIQEVFDIETDEHHTLFADGIAVHNCQHFDSEHLGELGQVQKAFPGTRTTVFAGTSLDLDTCLEHQYQMGSRGVWHIHCGCKDGWHALDNKEMIPKMMSVDGLRCPHSSRLLNPMIGEFVHEDSRILELKQVSFHLPQLIVPEYASGEKFISIWKDFKKMSEKQFLQEVMGIPVESGVSELNEADIKACCGDRTFAQIQADYLSGKVRYAYVFSGCDWGGSDWNPATKVKQSYTVHTIYGLRADGIMELIYACRYAGMNYQDIAGTIVAAHNKFKAFAIGTDNGGGSYYNAYMRDCGRIPTNKIISFNYTDTKLLLERIPHPEAHIMSLHRSDSISALISDIKAKKILWPRWDESMGFVTDCLNMRRNITESQSGRAVMRYVRHGSKADDFMQSTNYACMMKRIVTQESLIPNRQILDEIGALFGTREIVTTADQYRSMGGHVSG